LEEIYKESLLYYCISADVHAMVFTSAKILYFRMLWPTTVLVFPLVPTLLVLIKKRAPPYPHAIATSVAEPEPQGAASIGRSRSRNAMWLRLLLWYPINHGWEFKMIQNVTVYNPFSSYFPQIKSSRIKRRR
jgi:hypothetical protein